MDVHTAGVQITNQASIITQCLRIGKNSNYLFEYHAICGYDGLCRKVINPAIQNRTLQYNKETASVIKKQRL